MILNREKKLVLLQTEIYCHDPGMCVFFFSQKKGSPKGDCSQKAGSEHIHGMFSGPRFRRKNGGGQNP